MDNHKTKIAIVTRSLAHGGLERFSGLLSKMLTELGFEIHLVSILDEIEYEYEGELFNLGLQKSADNTTFGRFKRFLILKKYLKQQNFDWIIDNRNRNSSWSEWLISKYVYQPKKVIYMVHSFKTDYYFPANAFMARNIYKDSPYIVAVSKDIQALVEKKYGYQNLITIYNPIDSERLLRESTAFACNEKFILAYGRIDDDVKNFSLLIDSYADSILPQQNILLYILGDGKDVAVLKSKVEKLDLSEKVIFKPKVSNPFPYVKAALFTTLTSRYEGFPMSIIESLAIGTPVLSVDCHSGPREIIQNEQNGLLVENHNQKAFSQAMNRLVQEEPLYKLLKENTAKSVSHLSLSSIAKQWHQLLTSQKFL